MSYLIIGASSGLGRELSIKFAQENNNLIIVSRDLRDLNALKSDLELRFKVKVDASTTLKLASEKLPSVVLLNIWIPAVILSAHLKADFCTSVAVTFEPSWNFISSLRVKVHFNPSGCISHVLKPLFWYE